VQDLTGVALDPTTIVIEQEKKFVPPIGGVDTEMDIFVDDPQHRVVIEIQRVWYDAHYDRFFHYWLVAMVELVKGYLKYKLNRTVYVIVWLMQKVDNEAYQRSIITTSLHTETQQGETLPLYPHKLYCLNPHYVDENTPAGVADWMKLVLESMKYAKSTDLNLTRPIIQKAAQSIEGDGLTPQERAKAIDRGEFEEKLQKDVVKESKKARQEQAKETARKMLADGLDLAVIVKYTGLSADELAGLSAE
jgi:hypothetical protein